MPSEIKAGLRVLAFRSSVDWDAWLADQPRESPGLWLKLAKKGSGLESVSQQDAIDTAICHGWIDGQLDKFDTDHWLIRFTPRKAKGRWSAKNRARAERLIAEGRMKHAGLEEIDAAKADGRWDASYESQGKIAVPEDLAAALDDAPHAKRFFGALDSANRYAILYRRRRPAAGSSKNSSRCAPEAKQFIHHGRNVAPPLRARLEIYIRRSRTSPTV